MWLYAVVCVCVGCPCGVINDDICAVLFRPHRRCSVHAVSVCVSHDRQPCTTAEPIVIPFWELVRVDPRNRELNHPLNSFTSPTHSFIPGLKPSFSANPSYHSPSFFFFNIHYMDSPDCLLLFLSMSVFYF